ncbi:MAG: hypothetical protein BGO01_17810 [Armatimonadetes bacterium 55-13]|nr:hypothetical protein [Armatimonadota bacterium]OJU63996.1 MAG: hypothetical protein BGO01_17810 [Armatimonadetes bacterium 55-13]
MLTEFEVRRELETIQSSDAPPGEKARRLLRLDKSLRTQAQALVEAQARTQASRNRSTAAQLERMATNAVMMRDEVRGKALSFLKSRRGLYWHTGF